MRSRWRRSRCARRDDPEPGRARLRRRRPRGRRLPDQRGARRASRRPLRVPGAHRDGGRGLWRARRRPARRVRRRPGARGARAPQLLRDRPRQPAPAGIATIACSSSCCAVASRRGRVASARICTRVRRAGTPTTTGRSRRSATPSRRSSGASPPTSRVSAGSTSCWPAAVPRCGRCSRACPTSWSSASPRSPWRSPRIHLEPGGSPERTRRLPRACPRCARARGPADPVVAELHAVVSLQRARSRGDSAGRASGGDARQRALRGCGRSRPERRALVLVLLGACESLWSGRGARGTAHLRTGIALARRERAGLRRARRARPSGGPVASPRAVCRPPPTSPSRPLPSPRRMSGSSCPISAPALLALGWAEYLWCDSASVETLARAADAARASSDLPLRLQIAALSALTQLDSSDGARRALETLRGSVDEVGDWQPPDVLEQQLRSVEARAAPGRRRASTRQSRSRAPCPTAQRAA